MNIFYRYVGHSDSATASFDPRGSRPLLRQPRSVSFGCMAYFHRAIVWVIRSTKVQQKQTITITPALQARVTAAPSGKISYHQLFLRMATPSTTTQQ